MTASKIVAAAASGVGGAGLDVDEVFSTYLVTGTGSAYTVNNGIDLSGEGGLVWIKNRSSAGYDHTLYDTERSGTLFTDTTNAASDYASEIASYNNNGFTTVSSGATYNNVNGQDYVSWTFRKAPKFFDIQTWTGTGNARTISHNLGQVPGVIIVKRYSATEDWNMFHRSLGNTKYLQINGTGQAGTSGTSGGQANLWNNTDPTSTEFSIGTHDRVNTNSESYIAYIFAHHNSDGGFGPDSDADIIKCGSFTHPNNTSTVSVNLGFEPQWILFKANQASVNWYIFDVMRGIVTGGLSGDGDAALFPNTSGAENVNTFGIDVTSTGFDVAGNNIASSGNDVIYMAIRRGPLAAPDDATKVFEATTSLTGARQNGDTISTTLDHVDWHFARKRDTTFYNYNQARITGWKYLSTNTEDAEATAALKQGGDQNKLEYTGSWHGAHSNVIDYFFKRAPSFFDIVCYDGSGSNRTISHNLGVAPEMIWVKSRSNSGLGWMTYHTGTGATHYMMVNSNGAAVDLDVIWNDTAPTSSVFSVGTGGSVNDSGKTYIAYLFATVAGVSKVGSYTGNGGTQNIDCGFSSGARFVLIKNRAGGTNWVIFDSVRGIVSGNDPYLLLNTNAAEVTNTDYIDPYSGGFAVTGVENDINASGDTFIFYAVA